MPLPTRGFTLIELLVVIALITMLSAIVLQSIRSARLQGSDTGIKAALDTIRKQAVYYYLDGNYTYGAQPTTTSPAAGTDNCSNATIGMWSDPKIKSAVVQAEANSGTGAILGMTNLRSVCGSGSEYWAIAVVLRSDTNLMWCVDSRGQSKTINRSTIAGGLNSFQGCI